jgi:hypothetical protein
LFIHLPNIITYTKSFTHYVRHWHTIILHHKYSFTWSHTLRHSLTHTHTHTHTRILDVNVLTHSIILNTQTCYRFIHIHSCSHIKLFLHMSILTLPLTCSHIRIPTIHSLRYSRIHTNTNSHIFTCSHNTQLHEFAQEITYTLADVYFLWCTCLHIQLYMCINIQKIHILLLTNIFSPYHATQCSQPWISLHIYTHTNTLYPSYKQIWSHIHIFTPSSEDMLVQLFTLFLRQGKRLYSESSWWIRWQASTSK